MNHGPAMQQPGGSFWTSRKFILFSLIAANIGALVAFAVQGGSILQVLWIYWAQSVIIGAISLVRIMKLPLSDKSVTSLASHATTLSDGSTEHTPPPSRMAQRVTRAFIGLFFVMHYGGFHFGYLIFIIAFGMRDVPMTINGTPVDISFGTVSILTVVMTSLVFAVHHILSYVAERRQQQGQETWDLGRAMVKPYSRILSMHLTIIAAPFVVLALGQTAIFAIFMVLKTIFDVRLYQKGVNHPFSKLELVGQPSKTTAPRP